MNSRFITPLWLLLFYFQPNTANTDQLPIADFSKSSVTGWEDIIFTGKTAYELYQLVDKVVLKSESRDSASGLIKEVRVDLKKYPYLNWSWNIENRLDPGDEKTKSGDDYAARIYAVVDGGFLPWRTRAVNYVWASSALKGETWPNAYAGKNAIMVAVRGRQDKTSTWYWEKRNVYEDLKELFGTEFQYIDAIAIMTDTDNSHGTAKSYYGDIYFTAR